MSIEIWVLSDSQLNSVAEWQAAIDAEGYPLRLSTAVTFAELRGFFSMQLRGERSGCECYHDQADALVEANPQVDFGHAWKYVLGFRWGGSFEEMQAAWMAATAYAAATKGVVIDDQELKIRTAEESRRVVDDIVQNLPKMDEIVRNELLHKLETAFAEIDAEPKTDLVSLHDRLLHKLKLGPYRES